MKKKVFIILAISVAILAIVITCAVYIVNKDNKKIDVYVSTNHFSSTIEKMLNEEEKYKGKRVSISGYLKVDESGNIFVVRTYVGAYGSSEVGLLVKGNRENFESGDWVKVIGKINYTISNYETKNKVPYVYIEKIEKVKKQEDDEYVVN